MPDILYNTIQYKQKMYTAMKDISFSNNGPASLKCYFSSDSAFLNFLLILQLVFSNFCCYLRIKYLKHIYHKVSPTLKKKQKTKHKPNNTPLYNKYAKSQNRLQQLSLNSIFLFKMLCCIYVFYGHFKDF